jgi:alpha-galactosidase
MPAKIALIGAGSAVFSLNLLRDLCLTPNLHDGLVCMMDINEERLDAVYQLCRRYADEVGVNMRLEKTLDRGQALQDADFVVNTALTAGHQRLRDGLAIGQRHGYRFGGSYHVMHDEAFWINFYQLRHMVSLTEDILTICPNAWHVMVANPVLAATTYLGRTFPEAKVVGLCHGFSHVYDLAELLGYDREHLTFEIPGVNHFVWLTKAFYKGQDIFPRLNEFLANEAEEYWRSQSRRSTGLGPAAFDLYQRYGAFPIGDTCTPGGGAWPWWYHTDEATEQRWHEDPAGWWQRYFGYLTEEIAEIKQVSSDLSIRVTDHFPPEKSDEVIVPLLESLACDIPRVIIANIFNTGNFVPGVPADFEVEIPTLVSRHGIQGIQTQPLPAELQAYILRDRVAPVNVELEAFATGRKDLLHELILMDPWTRSQEQAAALLDDILELPYHDEMRAHFRHDAKRVAV